ncbi:phosphoglycerate dehydrogenase [Alkaliphilus peptidifermentans]|uniref:D-3-phosphoglycerate dehydrogenase n=1 Tax=Alkaliphilus peptidifermentans DSM 18978 TaxID=1120976 RepID=A0A1G5GIH6_9FIRM|nr:phosphoglycerate dehydrogenase [Alkaliphilus peptidifermentans]SCY51376.1 D-3-phosphoglycerate dehydrogenase [Alkaliphilus peptidifermentans DSM 18978]
MKILVTEKIATKGIDAMLQSGAIVDEMVGINREHLLEIIAEYDALVVRSVTKVDEELYERAGNLKVVGRAGNGIDNIEIEGATKRGIIVVNTPDANSVSAAEMSIGLLLASCRNITQADALLRSKVWDRKGFKGIELNGKTVGIVGLGRIGSLVATRLQAFGMKTIAYDPYITDERFKKFGVEKKEILEDLVRESDFITLHTPKTEETFGMIGEEAFRIAKKGIVVVNCARGGIVDEDALVKAIEDGTVAYAGIDVLVQEPNTTSPLLELKNVVNTPHLGADTVEAQDNVGITIAEEVISALRGEMVPNAVNLPTLHHQEVDGLRAFLKLGETLGRLYHQLEKEAVKQVEVVYSGEIAKQETEVITLAVLKGLFEPVLMERVNYVNAMLTAKQRGVMVTESKTTEIGNYLNLVQVRIITNKKEYTYSGTIFGKEEPRIVEVNGFEFDVSPTKYMLVAENQDQPGMIGQIGTLLGKRNINIATMQVSRNLKGKNAMMFLTIDSEVSKEEKEQIKNIDGISRIKFIKL